MAQQSTFLPFPFTTASTEPELITQGAEALLYKTTNLDSTKPAALKVRPSKPYRHPTLDARLTKQRVLAEARVLVKLSGLRSEGVCVPSVLSLECDVGRKVKRFDGVTVRNAEVGGAWLLMDWIDGKSVKELLREWDVWFRHVQANASMSSEELLAKEEDVKGLLRRLGHAVGVLHSKGGVVHGDLTSSNIMVRPLAALSMTNGASHDEPGSDTVPKEPDLNGEIVLIDFGLATQSVQEEDRAVDLYVLERAFGSTHPRQEGWFDAEVLQSTEGYRGSFKGATTVLKRLEEVRMRGRKRTMIG